MKGGLDLHTQKILNRLNPDHHHHSSVLPRASHVPNLEPQQKTDAMAMAPEETAEASREAEAGVGKATERGAIRAV